MSFGKAKKLTSDVDCEKTKVVPKPAVANLRQLFKYYAYLLVIWGFFRFLFKFPDLVEELWFKPLIWLIPILFIWVSEKKRRLNFFKGDLVPALSLGVGLGAAYWIILILTEFLKRGAGGVILDFRNPEILDFAGISLATAITEELAFSGYVLSKLSSLTKNTWVAIGWTCLLFTILHIPIGLFIYKYSLYQLVFFLVLVFAIQLGNTWVMSRTKNILAPIFSHWLWGLAAFLLL
jgi:membrane protease YdiL (CAAX protease family)